MLYDPRSLEPYAPLWVWGPRDYLHLRGVEDVSLQQIRGSFAFDGHVTCRLNTPPRWAVHQALRDPETVVVRMTPHSSRIFRGLLPWLICGLHVEVYRKKAGTTYFGTIAVNARTQEAVVELPALDLPADERRLVLAQLRDAVLQLLPGAQLVGASLLAGQARSALTQLASLPALAMDGGTLRAHGQNSAIVAALIGDHRMLTSIDRVEGDATSYTLIAAAETKVSESPVAGLVRLEARPPTGKLDLRVFNRRLAASPLRLFSWELLRVLQTLKVLRLWFSRWADVAKDPPSLLDADIVADKRQAKAYACLDDFSKCFTPVPHLWRQHADTTWHGLPAPHIVGQGLLDRL